MKYFVEIQDHTRDKLVHILQLSRYIKSHPLEFANALQGKILASLFYEPSTRTQLSFQSAMLRLGGQFIGFSGTGGTSVKKGESLTDTIHMASAYADAIVLRHPFRGSSRLASEIARDIPVISAGAGSQSHPTQALLDLMTIWETQNKVTHLEIGFTGDLRYSRTVPLLTILGIMGPNNISLFSHPLLKLSQSVRDDLDIYPHLEYNEFTSLDDNMNNLDVLYFTRIQRERFPDDDLFNQVNGAFTFKDQHLSGVKDNFVLLHPLPRVDEIPYSVDNSKHAKYFQQAKNGVFVRMALLLILLAPEKLEDFNFPKNLDEGIE
jgi:aspartate carbamoyltransferase catalytic subunit